MRIGTPRITGAFSMNQAKRSARGDHPNSRKATTVNSSSMAGNRLDVMNGPWTWVRWTSITTTRTAYAWTGGPHGSRHSRQGGHGGGGQQGTGPGRGPGAGRGRLRRVRVRAERGCPRRGEGQAGGPGRACPHGGGGRGEGGGSG